MRSRAALAIAWIPAVVLMAAAVAKAINPSAIAQVWLWLGVSSLAIALAATVAVVAVEAALGAWLLINPGSAARLAGLVTLCGFTGVLVVLVLSTNPPSCGCFGLVRHFQTSRTELVLGIGRNLLLMACLVFPGFSARPPLSKQDYPAS